MKKTSELAFFTKTAPHKALNRSLRSIRVIRVSPLVTRVNKILSKISALRAGGSTSRS